MLCRVFSRWPPNPILPLSTVFLFTLYCVSIMTLDWIEHCYFLEGETLLSETATFEFHLICLTQYSE